MSDCLVLNGNYQPLSLVPVSTVPWQVAIKLCYLNRVVVVEEYEDWLVRSPSLETKVPAIIALTKYFPIEKNIKFSRDNMYLRDLYQCQYCHESFDLKDLTIDHVIPLSKGGKTEWENCTTACTTCNYKKGNNLHPVPNVKPYQPDYYGLTAKRRKMPFKVRHSSWREYLG